MPGWLVGVYSRRGKVENNVPFHSDDRSLTFRGDGTYTDQLGSLPASNGTFSVSGNTISFATGSLIGTHLTVSTNFDATCRILHGLGADLWRHAEVTGCPTGARVSATDCSDVGTFGRTMHSGGFDSSGSGSETDFTETVTLYRDRFYTADTSSFKTTCFQGNCISLANESQTLVGDWSQAGGAPPYTMSNLLSGAWSFQRSSTACP